ncbi:MAG: TIM barrel protein [Candidatus Dormibacteraeota bacterium]|nr:TIM barrel protein [Candidatus Dormibacteraeota bacterium]
MTDRIKVGLAGYPAPAGLTPAAQVEWWIDEARRLDLDVVPVPTRGFRTPDGEFDLDTLRRLRARADEAGLVIEPGVDHVFGLASHDATMIRAAERSFRAATILGGPYCRTGYGRLEVATSRFNLDIPLRDHLATLTASLREAARIAEAAGIVIAVENHCDFRGPELAQMLADVNSPHLRALLDTGNSYTVFSDPDVDVAALAPWTVMTHVKDMRVEARIHDGEVPFRVVGCAIGEGHVDVENAIRLVFAQGDRGTEIPLVVETGWLSLPPGEDPVQARRDALIRSAARIREMVTGVESARELAATR